MSDCGEDLTLLKPASNLDGSAQSVQTNGCPLRPTEEAGIGMSESPASLDDLAQFADAFADLEDHDLMSRAWR